MREVDKIKEFLNTFKKIVITTHYKPDADALGSSLALANYLEKLGHHVNVIVPSDYPLFLNWIHNNSSVIIYDKKNSSLTDNIIYNSDLIFCLDYSTYSRLNELGTSVENSKALKIVIDHHLDPQIKADAWYWDSSSAATCQLIYEFIYESGNSHLIDTNIAECIYAGIMTDTGSFRYPSTTCKVHQIISDLIHRGVDNSKIHTLVYDNGSEKRLRFLGFALSERLTVRQDLHTAFFEISSEDLAKFDSQTGDTEGVINYALSIEGVILAVMITERDESVRMSFRSSGDFSVSDFSAKYFSGGGHKNAAGGKSNVAFNRTSTKLLEVLESIKEQLHTSYLNGKIQ